MSGFYDKLPTTQFARVVWDELNHWKQCIMVGERDEWTRNVMEPILERGWPHCYREVYFDKVEGKLAERLGITQGKPANARATRVLQEYLDGGLLEPTDEALQWEINSYMWQDDGQARANKPYKDDMLRAVANALHGISQIEAVKVMEVRKRPLTMDAKLLELVRPDYDPDNPVHYDDEDDFADMGTPGGPLNDILGALEHW